MVLNIKKTVFCNIAENKSWQGQNDGHFWIQRPQNYPKKLLSVLQQTENFFLSSGVMFLTVSILILFICLNPLFANLRPLGKMAFDSQQKRTSVSRIISIHISLRPHLRMMKASSFRISFLPFSTLRTTLEVPFQINNVYLASSTEFFEISKLWDPPSGRSIT